MGGGRRWAILAALYLAPLLARAPAHLFPALPQAELVRSSLIFLAGYAVYVGVGLPWLAAMLLRDDAAEYRRLMRRARRGAYLGFCLLAGALLLEASLRLRPALIPQALLARMPDQGKALFRGHYRGQLPDPELGHRLRPGVSWSYEYHALMGDLFAYGVAQPTPEEAAVLDREPLFSARLDERGYRGATGQGGPRILFLGDSFLYNADYASEEIWCATACRMLDSTCINLGIFGYGPPQAAIVLEREIAHYRPDLVALCVFEGNDLQDSWNWAQWRASALPVWKWESRDRGWWDYSPARAWAGLLLDRAVAKLLSAPAGPAPAGADNPLQPYRGEICGTPVVMGFAPPYLALLEGAPEDFSRHGAWPWIVQALEDCKRLCREHGAQLLVVMIPCKPSVYAWHLLERHAPLDWARAARLEPPSEARGREFIAGARLHRHGFSAALAAEVERLDLPYLDLRPAFFQAALAGAPPLYRSFDTHWTVPGHELAAAAFADYLRAHPELLPDTPKAP